MAIDEIARAMAMDAMNNSGGSGGTSDTYTKSEIDKKLDAVIQLLADYVKNTDYATAVSPGLAYFPTGRGLFAYSNGMIGTAKPTDDAICEMADNYRPLVPSSIPVFMENYGIPEKTTIPEMQAALADVLHLGIGEIITNGSDLDDYTDPGAYRTISSSVTGSLINCPVNIQAAIRLEVSLIIVSADGNKAIIQKIFPNEIAGSFYMRVRSTARGWGDWHRYEGDIVESRKRAEVQTA